jgi:hypothetical protein
LLQIVSEMPHCSMGDWQILNIEIAFI